MNRQTALTIGALSLIIVLVFLYYLNIRKENQTESFDTTPAAAVFSSGAEYTDVNGNNLQLDSYAGTVVIAVAWASWCPACIDQLTILDKISKEYNSISVLAFNRAEPRQTAKDFLSFYNLDTTIQLVMDPTDNFFTSIEGRAMPETVVFSPTGEILHHERDLFTKEEVLTVLGRIMLSNQTE